MKKNITLLFKLSAISTCLLGASHAFAASPTPPDPSQSIIGQLQAINNNVQVVGNRMQAIAETNLKAQNGYATNPTIMQSLLLNPNILSSLTSGMSNAYTATNTDVTNQLQPFADNLLDTSTGMPNANAIAQRLTADSSLIANLSINLPASDTIYSNDPNVTELATQSTYPQLPSWGLTQPSTLNDDYFNFGSLIQPMAYTATNQTTAAQNFVTFLTQGYNNAATSIASSLNTLMGGIQKASPTGKITLYIDLLTDPNYVKYQLSTRSATAMRSVVVNNLQTLISERTPITGLGTQSGVVDSNNNPVPNASPLQVESYLATHRINSPTWYSQVQSESPANVQREILVVLSEIEAQNFQNHLDNERLLATISAQVAASSAASSLANASAANQVNTDINNFLGLPPSAPAGVTIPAAPTVPPSSSGS